MLPDPAAPRPGWVFKLAEAIGGWRLDSRGTLVPVPPREYLELRDQAANNHGDDLWSRFARWFVDDPKSRTISPTSCLTWKDYEQQAGETQQ